MQACGRNIIVIGYVENVDYLMVHEILLGDDNYHVAVEVEFVDLFPSQMRIPVQHWLLMSLDPSLRGQYYLSYFMI